MNKSKLKYFWLLPAMFWLLRWLIGIGANRTQKKNTYKACLRCLNKYMGQWEKRAHILHILFAQRQLKTPVAVLLCILITIRSNNHQDIKARCLRFDKVAGIITTTSKLHQWHFRNNQWEKKIRMFSLLISQSAQRVAWSELGFDFGHNEKVNWTTLILWECKYV